MMNYLNIKDINELYQDVPQLFNKDLNLPSSLSELEVKEKLFDLSDFNKNIQEFGIFRVQAYIIIIFQQLFIR